MTRKFPVGKPWLPAWTLPGLSLLVALTAQGLWLVPRLETPAAREPDPAPRITAYSGRGSQVWSPILFSLPSSIGFSGAMKQDGVQVLPPLQSPLDLRERLTVDPVELFPPAEPPSLAGPLEPPPATALRLPRPADAESPVGWRLELVGTGGTPPVQNARFPFVPPSQPPLVVTGSMRFDRYGQVRSLVVDPPAPASAQREEILSSLWRVRLPRSPEEDRRLRFRLSLETGEVAP